MAILQVSLSALCRLRVFVDKSSVGGNGVIVAAEAYKRLRCLKKGVVGAGHIELEVGVAGDEEGIGNHTDRCRVDNNVVELVAQLAHHAGHVCRHEQFIGVRRDRPGGQYIEVCVDLALDKQCVDVAFLPREVGGHATLVGKPEVVRQHRAPEVHTYYHHLLAHERVGESKV